ncbi:unnamed protein product [Rhizophagus irregularis]|nr:unnamed protein product [Rhizophagus irregularis]CAB5364754.1 unnamed protein product [Rhizophagus irregularis]
MSNFAKRRRKAAKLKQHEELNEQIANFSPLHIENPVEDYGWSDCYPASVTSEDTKQLETRPKKRDSLDTRRFLRHDKKLRPTPALLMTPRLPDLPRWINPSFFLHLRVISYFF